MTVKKSTKCEGLAAILSRQRLLNANQQIDLKNVGKSNAPPLYNKVVGFNEKDQLELKTKDSDKHAADTQPDEKTKYIKNESKTSKSKVETIKIDDIVNCVDVGSYPNCAHTLVFYAHKNQIQEAIAVKFDNEQDFKRIYFTYKYFKMRNRLTKGSSNNSMIYASAENLLSSKRKYTNENAKRKTSVESNSDQKLATKNEYDLMQTMDNNGVMHLSVQQKNQGRFDQPMSLITLDGSADLGEIDSVIYTDVDVPTRPQRRRPFFAKLQKPKGLPPSSSQTEGHQKNIMKGQFVRVNIERPQESTLPNLDSRLYKLSEVTAPKDNKSRIKALTSAGLWSNSKGYESDREEWRSSRSQFSTTQFDSLARPGTGAVTAYTLRKPAPPHYYRLTSDVKPPTYPTLVRTDLNNYVERNAGKKPPKLANPPRTLNMTEFQKRTQQLNNDHRKFVSLQNLEQPRRNIIHYNVNDFNNNMKKTNAQNLDVKKLSSGLQAYSNLSSRLSGLTNKIKEFGSGHYNGNSISRLKSQSTNDVTNLKPVIKKSGTALDSNSKRQVLRTCSVEPPKKVTFSAFATVQVV